MGSRLYYTQPNFATQAQKIPVSIPPVVAIMVMIFRRISYVELVLVLIKINKNTGR